MAGSEVHIPPESDDFQLKVLFAHFHKPQVSWLNQCNEIEEIYSKSGLKEFWNCDADEYRQFLLATPIHQQNLFFKIWSLHFFHAKINGLDRLRVADKTPLLVEWTEWLNTVSPNSVYIFLIRDVRDAIASRMKHFGETLEQAFSRYNNALKAMKKFEKKQPDLVLRVQYENLVYHTSEELNRICDFAGLKFSENMLKKQDKSLGDDHLSHHSDVHKAISDRGIGRWKEQLTTEQIEKIMSLCKRKNMDDQMIFFN